MESIITESAAAMKSRGLAPFRRGIATAAPSD
jgi:hypothetical protein